MGIRFPLETGNLLIIYGEAPPYPPLYAGAIAPLRKRGRTSLNLGRLMET
jgi:hypothetical protein